jgi:large repetitive protein
MLPKSLLLKIGLLLLVLTCWTTQLRADTYNRTACGGGVITSSYLFTGVPGGLTSGGDWIERDGLNFVFLNDGQFYIEGFVSGATYTIRWRKSPGKTLTFNISVPVDAGIFGLTNDKTPRTTSDVLLCAGDTHRFHITGVGTVTSYGRYYQDVTTQVTRHSGNSIQPFYDFVYPTGSNAAFDVFSIVTHTIGGSTCFAKTNQIGVSSDNILLQVVGGGSVCANPLPNLVLEVRPYDESLASPYVWRRNGILTGTGRTVNTNGIPGDYTVSVDACSGTIVSAPVTLSSFELIANLIPSGIVPVCSGSIELRGTSSYPVGVDVDFSWHFNGLPALTSGTGGVSTIAASDPGSYVFKIHESGNELCYDLSDAANLNMIGFYVNDFTANGATTFCGTTIPSINLNVQMDGAVGQINVIITNITNSTSQNFSVNSNENNVLALNSISGNAEYRITSISGGGCSAGADLLSNLSSIDYTREPDPSIYSLTGDPGGCEGASTVIGLSGSQTGIKYELLRNNVPLSPVVEIDGTGGAVPNAFTVSNAGVYTVRARSGSCPYVTMNGSRQLFAAPLPVSLDNTGLVCPSGEVRLNTSYSGTIYQLLRNGVATGATRNGSTGNPVTFGDQSIVGVYTVRATTGGDCFLDATGQLTIQGEPNNYNLSANNTTYCASAPLSGVTLTLSGSQNNVSYRLYRDGSLVSTVSGDGNPITWTNQIAGTYSVRAINDGGCDILMSGVPVISIAPLPTAEIFIASAAFRRCQNAIADFRLGVNLTGTAPFSFDIINNAGLPTIQILNHPSPIFTPISVDPNQSVIYTIVNLRDASNCNSVPGTGSAQFFVDPLPSITFSPENPQVCAGGAPVAITAQGAGTLGSYFWSDGLGDNQQIIVSPPSTSTYTVTATTQYGCAASRAVTVAVNPLPVVDFIPPGNDYSVCQNGGVISLTPSPGGGSFSGLGIIPATFNFNPAVAGAGTHNITYTYQDANTCINSITKPIIVTLPPTINITGLAGSYCANDGDALITGTPTHSRGDFELVGRPSGAMWNDNGNGTMILSPSGIVNSGSGPGDYTIRYTYTDLNGCVSTMDRTTTIQEDINDVLRFRGLPVTTCQTNPTIVLQAYFYRSPAPDEDITTNDGTFSGPGVTDNGNGSAVFDPSVAGNGLHTVNYTYRDPITGCRANYSQQVQVGTTISINGLAGSVFCSIDGPQSWWGTPPTGRMAIYANTFDSANLIAEKFNPSAGDPFVFTPSASGPGTYVLVYEHTDISGCSNVYEEIITVEAVLSATFTTTSGLTQFCRDAGLVTLQRATGASPGGYYSGPGVSGNTFNPAVAGVGVHTIRRTVATPTCSDTKDLIVTVIGYETIFIDNLADDYCENAVGPFLIEVNNPDESGAVYTIQSTTNAIGRSPLYTLDGAGDPVYQPSIVAEQVYFDPAYVGIGHYTVTYTFNNTANNGCVSVYSKTVEVLAAPDVNFGGIANPIEYCQDDGLVLLEGSFVSGGLTGAGNFLGAGIDNGTPDDGSATFNPAMVTPGNHPITYNYIHPNGCTTSRTKLFNVKESPIVYMVTPHSGTELFPGNFCFGDPGVVIGLENSQVGVSYQLILNGNTAAPVHMVPGIASGDPIVFPAVNVPGDYTVMAVLPAPSGCSVQMDGVVRVRINTVAATINKQNVSCNSATDGRIEVTASGGSVSYVYYLYESDGTTLIASGASNVFTGLEAGTYYVEVQDALGCELSSPIGVEITEPSNALSLTVTKKDVGCSCTAGLDCDGEASVSITGGTPFSDLVSYPTGYSITWRDAANTIISNSANIEDRAPGIYTVRVVDRNGCWIEEVVTIGTAPVLALTEDLAERQHIVCNGSATGRFVVNATGGNVSTIYQFSLDQYNWFGPDVAGGAIKTFSGLLAGLHNVYVRDANYPDCTYELPGGVTLTQLPVLTLTEVLASHQNVSCFGDDDGSFEVLPSGGSGDYEFTIDNGVNWQTSRTFNGLNAGTYYVWVRDENNTTCEFRSLPVTISEPSALSLSLTSKTNVSCNSANNGSFTVSASGGSSNYVYSRDAGTSWQVSPTFNNLVAGTYEVSVRDNSTTGCELLDEITVIITQPTVLSVSEVVALHQNVSCLGESDGAFTVQATGGSGNYEFSINNVDWETDNLPAYRFAGLSEGVYNVWVRDITSPSCVITIVAPINITEPLNPISITNVDITNVDCFGDFTGEIDITVSGGNPGGNNYMWYRQIGASEVLVGAANGGFTNNPSDLRAATYRVEVTDNRGCNIGASYIITQPSSVLAITVDPVNIKHVTSNGGNDGELAISIAGGTIPYSVIWTGLDEDNNPIAGLPVNETLLQTLIAGVYSVTVTDGLNCPATRSITISQPNSLLLLTERDKIHPGPCYGAANGALEFEVSGGALPYVLTLTTQSGTVIPPVSVSGNLYAYANLPAGIYHAVVVDDNGVSFPIPNIVLSQPDQLVFDFAKTRDASCFVSSDGEVVFSASGGTRFTGTPDYYLVTLIPDNDFNRTFHLELGVPMSVSDLAADNYRIRIDDRVGCNIEGTFTVHRPDEILITGVMTNISCTNANDGSVSINVSGGRGASTPYSYDWSKDGISGFANTKDVSGLEPGTYQLTISEIATTACGAVSQEFVISNPAPINVSHTPRPVNTCRGDNSGSIDLFVTGGVEPYSVSYGFGIPLTGTGPDFTIPNLAAGFYTVTVTDNNGAGCVDTIPDIEILEPSDIMVLDLLSYGMHCENNNTGIVSLEISGGVTNALGENSYRVQLLNTTTGNIQGRTILPGESPVVGFSTLAAGQYELTVIDNLAAPSAACPDIIEVFEIRLISINADIVHPTCAGVNSGSIDITVTGGVGPFNYVWTRTGDATFSETTQDLTGLVPGTYNLAFTDVGRGSCVINRSYVVSNTKSLTINASVTPVSCNGGNNGTITVTGVENAMPDLSYFWNGSAIAGTSQLTGLTSGTYTLLVMDGEGCVVEKSFFVPQPVAIAYSLSSTLDDCTNYSRSISVNGIAGGTTPYTYIWSGPGGFTQVAAGNAIENITVGGTYRVTVRDARNCELEQTITIPGDVTLSAAVKPVNCNGVASGEIDLTVSGGSGFYQYAWTKQGDTYTSASKDIKDLTAGIYDVRVTDLQQLCPGGDPYFVELEVVVPQQPLLKVEGSSNTLKCAGDSNGTISLNITGGTSPYNYLWTTTNGSGLEAAARDQVGLTAGSYTVRVTDFYGCYKDTMFVINEPLPLSFVLDWDDTDCDGNNYIEITAQTGGSGNYSYIWEGEGATGDPTDLRRENLPGGTYTVTMRDTDTSTGCAVSRSVTLTRNVTVTYSVTNESCPGSNNGTITLQVSNGTAPYSFSWTDSDGNPLLNAANQNQANLAAGTYFVEVTDSRIGGGCTIELEILVALQNNLQLDANITNVNCYGESTGEISLDVFLGSGDYSYLWTSGTFTGTSRHLESVPAGNYTVRVTDEVNGCVVFGNYVISQPSAPLAVTSYTVDPVLCKGESTGNIEITVNGGTGSYEYFWSGDGFISSPTNKNQEDLSAGNYYVTITDSLGCRVDGYGPIIITEPATEIEISILSVSHVTTHGGNNGSILLSITGGTGSYTYSWYDENDLLLPWNSSFANNLTYGVYRIVVEDDNGCDAEVSVPIYEPGHPLELIIEKQHAGPCFGAETGVIYVTVTGGEIPYKSITLFNGASIVEQVTSGNFARFEGLPAGDYTVEAIDQFDETIRQDVRIISPAAPLMITAAVTQQVECHGASTGIITATVTGGVPDSNADYQLSLIGGPSGTSRTELVKANDSFDFENLPKGTYTVRVIDDSNVKPVVAGYNTVAQAFGDNDFFIGVPGNLRNDCSVSQQLVVNQPEVRVNISVEPGSEEICAGEQPRLVFSTSGWDFTTDGNLVITLSTNETVTLSAPTVIHPAILPVDDVTEYTITNVSNTASCIKGIGTGRALVVKHQKPTASLSGVHRICLGSSAEIEVALTGMQPWSIVYSDGLGNTYFADNITESLYRIPVSPSADAIYELISVNDRYCEGTFSGSAEVSVYHSVTVELQDAVFNELCRGDNFNLRVNFNPTDNGPWNLSYSETTLVNGNPQGTPVIRTVTVVVGLLDEDDIFIIPVTPISSVRYELISVVAANDNEKSCPGIVTGSPVDIIVRERPAHPGPISGNITVCQGELVTYSIAPIPNATQYIWILPDGTDTIATNTLNLQYPIDAESGRLSVYAKNDCGVGLSAYLDITVNPLPGATGDITGPDEICQGQTNIVYRIDAVPNATEYIWNIPSVFTSVDNVNGTEIVVGLNPQINSGTYQITVTPRNACGNSPVPSYINIVVNATPNARAAASDEVIQICGDSNTMNALLESGETGQWSHVTGWGSVASILPIDNRQAVVSGISRGDVKLVWTVTSSSGCSASDTVTIRNNRLTVTASPVGSDVCSDTRTIRGTTPPYPGVTGQWSVVEPAGSTAAFAQSWNHETTVSGLMPGSNTLRWSLTQNGCVSYADVIVNNSSTGHVRIEGMRDFGLCDDEVTLQASNSYIGTGEWHVSSGYGFIPEADKNDDEITITNLSKGRNVIRWTVTNGTCQSTDSVIVRNNLLDVSAGDDRELCSNTVTLAGSPIPAPQFGETIFGQWSFQLGSGSFVNGSSPTTVVNNLARGTNILVWSVTKDGCTSSASVTITNNSTTTATINGMVNSTVSVCGFELVNLNGSALDTGETGEWSLQTGSGAFEDKDDPLSGVFGIGLGQNKYRWIVTNEHCSSFAEVTVNNNKVSVNAGADREICTNTTNLSADLPPVGTTGQWTIHSGGGNFPSGESTKYNALVNLNSGENILVWTVTKSGCPSFDTVRIINNRPEVVNAGSDATTGSNYTMQASPVETGALGTWTIISGGGIIAPGDLHLPNANVTNMPPGENIFRWTVTKGSCSAYDEVILSNGDVEDAYAGPDQNRCVDFAKLEATPGRNVVGRWSVVSGSGYFEDEYDPGTIVTNLGRDQNVFRWTLSYASSVRSDEVIITNNRPDEPRAGFFSPFFVGFDNAICDNSVELRGNLPLDGMGLPSWREVTQGGGLIQNVNSHETMVTGLAYGTNTFIYRIQKGVCYLEDEISVINGTPTTPDAKMVDGDTVRICAGSYLLKPNTPIHGIASWHAATAGQVTFSGNWVHNLSQGANDLIYRIATNYCSLEDDIVIVNNQVDPAYAGEDYNTCGPDYILNAWEARPSGAIGQWTRMSGGGTIDVPNDNNSTVTGLLSGPNRFRWTVTHEGCADFDEVIIYNDRHEARILQNDVVQCSDSFELRAANPTSGFGRWGVEKGRGNFDNNAVISTVVRNLERGENIITWTVTNGNCSHTDRITIVNDMATTADAGRDRTLCGTGTVELSGNVLRPRESGSWRLVDGGGDIVSPDSRTTTVNNIPFGRNIFEWTIVHEPDVNNAQRRCISSDQIVVENFTIVPDAGIDSDYCASEAVLNAVNPSPGIGTWSVPGGQGAATFVDTNNPNTTVTNLGKGVNTLRWTVDYKGCRDHSDVVVTNNLPSTPNAGNNLVVCDSGAQLNATAPSNGSSGFWKVLSGAGDFEPDATAHNARITSLANGDNILVWTTWKVEGCTLEDLVLIRNNEASPSNPGENVPEWCEPTYVLKAETPDYGIGSWSFMQGGGNISNHLDPRATVTNLAPGENLLKWTVRNGNCPANDNSIRIVNNTPTTANAGPDINDCRDWRVLDGNEPVHFDEAWWQVISGNGTFDNINDRRTRVWGLRHGENLLQWNIRKGSCVSSDLVTITNRIPDKANAGEDQILCDNYTVLNANNPVEGNGQWSVIKGQGSFDNRDNPYTTVRNVGFGENIFRWAVTYGECSTIDEMVVVSNKFVAYAGEDQIVYEPNAVLNANNAGALGGRWFVIGTSSAQFVNETFFNTNVYNLSEGINTFQWEIDVNGCISADQVQIDYRVVPDAGFITDIDTGCYPLNVRFTNYSVGGTVYHWDFGDGNSSGDRNPVHTFTRAGVFQVKLIAPGPDGNDGVFVKSIVVHEHPVADFTVNPTVVYVPGDKARFYDLSTDAITWMWDFGDGITSEERNPSHMYQEEGVYNVALTVSNSYGCENTKLEEAAIIAEAMGYVVFPNAFRPRGGGGGTMDPSGEYVIVFKPAYSDVDQFHLEVFNRWGQKIFETRDIDQGWDGLYEGSLAPQAVYVYKVTGRFINGREFRRSGSVLLVR